jgi:hypothetical protein
MCGQCEGQGAPTVLTGIRQRIWTHGWALASHPTTGRRVGFSYTIGLTRHHGHPELLVSGLVPEEAAGLLGDLAAAVRSGHRYCPGDVLSPDGAHRLQLVRVTDPARLAHAQAVYATPTTPVTAMQVVWSDHDGHWPWQPGWPGRVGDQPLFGLPLHH